MALILLLADDTEIEIADATYNKHYVVNCNSRAAYDAIWDNFTMANLEDLQHIYKLIGG